MVRIAYCDDDPAVLEQLNHLLERYGAERNLELQCTAYHSALDLLAAMERGQRYQIILLDVLMPGENGMDAAREIRQFDAAVKLIFLTSSPEYAVESYSVNAFHYHLKPIRQINFYMVMDQVMQHCDQEQEEKLVLKTKSGITVLAPSQLEYCEVMNHTLLLHLTDGETLSCSGKLDQLNEKLDQANGFLRIHRSYLVNMACIRQLTSKAVTLSSGVELPLPHGKFSELKDAYLTYAFETERVLL